MIATKNIQEIQISELTLLLENPRKVKKEAIERLAKSLSSPRGRELFQKRPVLVNDRDGKLVVYGGNQRLRAAQSLGWTTVPCIVDQISLQEEREETVKDNLVIGSWDNEILSEQFDFKDLEAWGMDLKELGIEPLGEEETEEVPEPPKEPRAERGKVYQLGKHRVMCGDSTNSVDVALLMDGKKADMVFTDPPYGVSYNKKNEWLNSIGKANACPDAIASDEKTVQDLQDSLIYPAFCRIKEILSERGTYYITSPQGGELLMMMMMMQKAEIPLRHMLIWVKNNHVLGRTDYNYKHEPILFGWIERHDFFGNGNHRFSVWEIDKPHSSKLHPTMKPVELIINALQNSTLQEMICADLFLGSGSTLIACEQTGRICYGMEIDPKYVDVIIERFCNYTGADKEAIYEAAK